MFLQTLVALISMMGAVIGAIVRDMHCLRYQLRQANSNLETEVGRRTQDLLLTNRVCCCDKQGMLCAHYRVYSPSTVPISSMYNCRQVLSRLGFK